MRRRRLESNDLQAAWERNANDWVRWAGPEKIDTHYWLYHRDTFLELLPPPSRVLDVGCGEGRLARDLAARGYDVVGIDLSPTMIAAAREASPDLEVLVGDAAALPFEDASFPLVVAFMSLQDVADMPGAVREAARVLAPGGTFALAIVHPLNSAGEFDGSEAESPFVIAGSYLDESYFVDEIDRHGVHLLLESVHRPLQAYVNAMGDAGLLVDRMHELRMPERAFQTGYAARWTRLPLYLHLRARKPA